MTTPSSDGLVVFGVLSDPAFLCQQTISSSENIHTVVQSLWKAINERVGETLTSQTPEPQVHLVLGEIGPFTPFKVLTCFHGYQTQIPSWTQPRRLSLPSLTTLRRRYIT